MRAAVCTRYGPPEVFQVRELPTPVPRAREVLVRIHAATVTISDCYIRRGVPTAPLWYRFQVPRFRGFGRPRRILGAVLGGQVVETGPRVTRFRPGDRLFAFTTCAWAAMRSMPACRSGASWLPLPRISAM